MARAVTLEKNTSELSGKQLCFIALKSWTCQLVAHVENLVKIETPLNVISV